MEDDSINVFSVISNVVRAVGAMSSELIFFYLLFFYFKFILIEFISFYFG